MLNNCSGINFYRIKPESNFIPKVLKKTKMKHISWNAFVTEIKAHKKSTIFK
jgi:hypothetical protein